MKIVFFFCFEKPIGFTSCEKIRQTMVGERLTQLEGEVQQLAPATPIDDLEAAKTDVDSKLELQVEVEDFS